MSPTNVSASVRARLKSRMRETGENYQALLTRFALERLLYRVSVSPFADDLILKGAYAFLVWQGEPHRPTKDIDFLGYGSASELEDTFAQICRLEVEDDGVQFDAGSVSASEIRAQDEYAGIRVKLDASIGSAALRLQVDVGFGDTITPGPQTAVFPTLLPDFEAPELKTYPPETVIAEKLDCIVSWGMFNTRMKDFYDLDYLQAAFDFEGKKVVSAIEATFRCRETVVPDATPIGLTSDFGQDPEKQAQWSAFGRRTRLGDFDPDLNAVVDRLRDFLKPPLKAIRRDEPFLQHWPTGGPWQRLADDDAA